MTRYSFKVQAEGLFITSFNKKDNWSASNGQRISCRKQGLMESEAELISQAFFSSCFSLLLSAWLHSQVTSLLAVWRMATGSPIFIFSRLGNPSGKRKPLFPHSNHTEWLVLLFFTFLYCLNFSHVLLFNNKFLKIKNFLSNYQINIKSCMDRLLLI